MKVMKEYMEWYAFLSLLYCYDENLAVLEKGEEPDWQSKDLDIGLEVTQALLPKDGEIRSVINEYFGKGLDGQFVKDQIEQRNPEYGSMVHVVKNTACFSQCYDMQSKIQQVSESIIKKTKKLNNHYSRFKNNWLYVFAPDLFGSFDIPQVYETYQKNTTEYAVKFDKIFIQIDNQLFILNANGLETEILIPNDRLSQLKKEALEKAGQAETK